MTQSEFTERMAEAIEAYKDDHPVVVLSADGSALHGRGFLETVRDFAMPLEAVVIRGIYCEQWNAGEYSENVGSSA